MIKQVKDIDSFYMICEQLNKVENKQMNSDTLFFNMAYNPEIITYMSYDNQVPTGCAVIRDTLDVTGHRVFFILFQWRDAHYPKLKYEFTQFLNDRAKELSVRKLVFTNSRNEDLVTRATRGLGFKKVYSVYERKVI